MIQKQYKIVLTGTQCVGKTTVLNELKKRFSQCKDVYLLDEGARIFFETHPNITERGIIVQERIQDFVLEREQHLPKDVACVVTDRSVIDPIVLTQLWDSDENAKLLYENVKDWISTYSFFYILSPKDVPLVNDEHRRESDEQRLKTHDLFITFCKEHNLRFEVIEGSLDERVDQIEKAIKEIIH